MVYTCSECSRNFESPRGLHIHYTRVHDKRNGALITNSGAIQDVNVLALQSNVETARIVNAEEIPIVQEETNKAYLPPFEPVIRQTTKSFAGIDGHDFIQSIDSIYEEIVQWRKNLFKLPTGNASKTFINELTSWLDHYNSNSDFQCIALKVFMVLPNIILQKPSKNSKAKEHLQKVESRMGLWKEGKLFELFHECRTIQQRLKQSKRKPIDLSKSFAKLMFQGKINAALKLLKNESDSGVHEISNDVIAELKAKHPAPAPVFDGTLLNGPINYVSPAYFDEIDELVILKAARLTKGAGGPSHLDADHMCHILTSVKFRKENKELRGEIARLTRKLATELVDPATLEAFTACRLIPLNKNPGVRPIGVGEGIRRIIGKSIGWTLKGDIQEAAGPLQAATGLPSGSEAAIHAMKQIFENEETDAVILVDASNAFNSLNRRVALHNVQVICPNFSRILINTYRQPSRMIVFGSTDILSTEGTTQGDNLAMPFYALGTDPLLRIVKIQCPKVSHVSLADDISGAATISNLKCWFVSIAQEGKKYGYYVNEEKSWLILKDSELLDHAKSVFQDSKIKITVEGKRHLGAAIGSQNFRQSYCEEKINDWCDEIDQLAKFAKSEPHAAYSAFIHGEMHKFTYFLRTIPDMKSYIEKLDERINNTFLPSLLESVISDHDRRLYALPIRLGGLGIPVLTEAAEENFNSSVKITAPLVAIMITQDNVLPDNDEVNKLKSEVRQEQQDRVKSKAENLEKELPDTTLRAVTESREKGASSWLSVLPLEEYDFTLNKSEFRDAINLRYAKPLRGLPSKCPCGQTYDVTHALNCKKGGFVTQRHNELRDYEAELLKKVVNDVEIEPPLQPITGEIVQGLSGDNARPDIRARGVWRKGQNAYFDVRITNLNSNSQKHLPVNTVLEKHEKEKKRQYNQRIMNIEHGTFTPLVFSISGSVGSECSRFHKQIANRMALKCEERYEKIYSIIRCRISFLILRSALMCIRGSRSHRSKVNVGTEDFEIACDTSRCVTT